MPRPRALFFARFSGTVLVGCPPQAYISMHHRRPGRGSVLPRNTLSQIEKAQTRQSLDCLARQSCLWSPTSKPAAAAYSPCPSRPRQSLDCLARQSCLWSPTSKPAAFSYSPCPSRPEVACSLLLSIPRPQGPSGLLQKTKPPCCPKAVQRLLCKH